MRILITGGSGFIGNPIVEKLIKSKKSYQILALTRKLTKNLLHTDHIDWLEGDLSKLSEVSSVIKNFKPEIVIHLAWKDIPDFSPRICIENLKQSIDFFELIWTVGSCNKIIVAGSCYEYEDKRGVCKESNITNSYDLFTWAKLSLLKYLQFETEFRTVCLGWFRIFYAYGPNQRKGSLIPTIIDQLKQSRLPELKNPKNSNDFIYVDDIAELFSLAVNKQFPSGVYNLGSGEATSVIDVCKIAESVILNQKTLSVALDRETRGSYAGSSFYSSMNLTKSVFDWEPSTELYDGIKYTYLKNPL